jgi:hypothetical protein
MRVVVLPLTYVLGVPGLELFEAALANPLEVAESIVFENEFKYFGNEVVYLFALCQIFKFIAIGTGGEAFFNSAGFDLAAFVQRPFAVTAFAFLLFECAAVVTYQTAVCQYHFFGHI